MSDALLFNCPSCSAPLPAPEDAEMVRCPYCYNTVIVPPGLRGEDETPSPQTISVTASNMVLNVEEIREQLAHDEKIEVIKRLRLATGLGLKEAQDVVEAIERGEDLQSVKIDSKKIGKIVGVTGASLTCVVVASILLVLATVLISLYFAFYRQGGEVVATVNEVIPTSMANVELQFGAEGLGVGQFTDPRTVAADREGNIYVGDYSTGRLQSFDAQGNFRWLVNLGEDNYIQALDIDGSGVLLMVSRGAIRRFATASGAELEQFPNPQGFYFEDLSVAPDGRLAVIADSEDFIIYDTSYNQVLYVPQAVSSISNDSELDSDIDIDGLGNVYVLGHFNGSVFKFTPQGKFANRISSEGDETGQISASGDLAVDGQGRVYISGAYEVQVFNPDGRYLDKFDLAGSVFGLNFDSHERLYTVSNEPQVVRLALSK